MLVFQSEGKEFKLMRLLQFFGHGSLSEYAVCALSSCSSRRWPFSLFELRKCTLVLEQRLHL